MHRACRRRARLVVRWASSAPGPLANYERRVADGRWRSDPAQVAALMLLERLHGELVGYTRDTLRLDEIAANAAAAAAARSNSDLAAAAAQSFLQESGSQALGRSWMASIGLGSVERVLGLGGGGSDVAASAAEEGNAAVDAAPAVQGVYIHGGVGCGKTMLMDLFFDGAPLAADEKRRVHFHAFMIEVHNRMHVLRKGGLVGDPIPAVAAEIGASCALLCFDEFQVTDIADALVMRRLFQHLMSDGGVVMVATSNREPEGLYYNGIQRDLFEPFIPYMRRMCVVHSMASTVDYRLQGTDAGAIYFLTDHMDSGPTGGSNVHGGDPEASVDALWSKLAKLGEGGEGEKPTRVRTQHGRELQVPRAAAAGGAARFTFDELCKKPLGPSDYIAVASHFHTVFLTAIPHLTLNDVNAVRRFITLIDTLYEHNVKVVISAAALPQHIFSARRKRGGEDHGDMLGTKTYAITEHDEIFAFERTVSRLTEMQSVEYLEGTHREDAGDKTALVALVHGDVAAAPAVFERFDVNLNERLDPFEAQRLMEELVAIRSEIAEEDGSDSNSAVPMTAVHAALREMHPAGEASLWQKSDGVELSDFVKHIEDRGLSSILFAEEEAEAEAEAEAHT